MRMIRMMMTITMTMTITDEDGMDDNGDDGANDDDKRVRPINDMKRLGLLWYQRAQDRFQISIRKRFHRLVKLIHPNKQSYCQRMPEYFTLLLLLCLVVLFVSHQIIIIYTKKRKFTLTPIPAQKICTTFSPIPQKVAQFNVGMVSPRPKSGAFCYYRNGVRMTVGLWRTRVGAELFLIGHILHIEQLYFLLS